MGVKTSKYLHTKTPFRTVGSCATLGSISIALENWLLEPSTAIERTNDHRTTRRILHATHDFLPLAEGLPTLGSVGWIMRQFNMDRMTIPKHTTRGVTFLEGSGSRFSTSSQSQTVTDATFCWTAPAYTNVATSTTKPKAQLLIATATISLHVLQLFLTMCAAAQEPERNP